MIGVVLVSHGALARVLLETASEIVGTIEPAVALSIARHERVEAIQKQLRDAIDQVDQGQGVLVLADMFGGTAANCALQLIDDPKRIEVVTGFSLPMVLKLAHAEQRKSDLAGLAQLMKQYGQRNVIICSEILKEKTS